MQGPADHGLGHAARLDQHAPNWAIFPKKSLTKLLTLLRGEPAFALESLAETLGDIGGLDARNLSVLQVNAMQAPRAGPLVLDQLKGSGGLLAKERSEQIPEGRGGKAAA